jgi:cytosine/adenosine deaminase-related metal-dependent hydrolase
MTTLVRGAWVLTMAGKGRLRDAAVAIAPDGSIAEVGAWDELRRRFEDSAVEGDGDGIVLPGFVNAHTHLTEALIPGMGEDATLWDWFTRVVGPTGAVITREDVRIGTRLKAAEMLLSGITSVSDMSCHRNLGSEASLGAADGLEEMGLRGVVSFGAEDVYPGAPGPELFLAEHEALADRAAAASLLSFRAGVGTILGISRPLLERTVAACREHDWGVHTHLSEVREEVVASRLEHGLTTVAYAAQQGLLDRPVAAAHCIWCTRRDLSLMRRREVAIVHNPVANMILASGVCPVPALLERGFVVALGTDGAASNDNQDMFGVLKTAALLHKVSSLDPTVLSAREILELATIGGARALGLDDRVGSIEPGKRGDVVLLDGATPELATIHDPWQQVVYCATARCVSDVWVDGIRRVRAGRLVDGDVRELAREARAAAVELVRRAELSESALLPEPELL